VDRVGRTTIAIGTGPAAHRRLQNPLDMITSGDRML
jgi:hypothetical protein